MDKPNEHGTEMRILAAAKEVFTRDGFDGARMQSIAETAGINKALLHYYFRSKQKLFEKVLYRQLEAFMPQIDASFASKETFPERMEALLDTYLGMLLKNPQLPMFVLFSIHRNPSFVDNIPRHIFQHISDYLQQEIDAGRIRKVDPRHFFISIVSMCMFPFVARNMAAHMMGMRNKEFDKFLTQRKTEIMHIVNAMILP